jgi:phage FluMu protein Com
VVERHQFRCWKCDRRLPCDDVRGSVVIYCPRCKHPNRVSSAGTLEPRFLQEVEVKRIGT